MDANEAWQIGDNLNLVAAERHRTDYLTWCDTVGILTVNIDAVLELLYARHPEMTDVTATELTDATGAAVGWDFPAPGGEVAVWCEFTSDGMDSQFVAAVTRDERVVLEARIPAASLPARQAEAARFVAWAHSTVQ